MSKDYMYIVAETALIAHFRVPMTSESMPATLILIFALCSHRFLITGQQEGCVIVRARIETAL
jgi:hypothetical protein